MDTSNSLGISKASYLVDGYRVPRGEITPHEWASLLGAALQRIKPQLKYLSGFYTIEDLGPGAHFVWHDDRVMYAAQGIGVSSQTRICDMATVQNTSAPYGVDFIGAISLTRDGRWLHAGYTRSGRGVHSDWFCQELTHDGMTRLLQLNDPDFNLGRRLFVSLQRMIQESIDRGEERLAGLRRAEARLTTMWDRIAE